MTTHRTDDTRRQAGWLPHEQDELERWLRGHRERAGAGPDRPLHPVVEAFRRELAGDPTLRMGVTRMIDQVPSQRAYRTRHVDDVDELLRLIDAVLTVAPEYGDSTMVMLPLAAVLDWTMATPAGYAVYRDPRMNRFLHDVLDVWSQFLSGPDSLSVLNDSPSGWLSPAARQAIGIDQFRHDPDADHLGFASWNDFFTRRLADGARPVAAPDDDAVIVTACESTPYRIAIDVRESSRFWLKDQPYSLHDLLAGDESVAGFVGGTVYQAFLSATDYHRWHSPVAGTVVRAFTVGGTYYSEADAEGSDADDAPDSQAYLAHVSARAVVIIDADDPATGLIAFVGVGMLEVSSCILDAAVVPGHHLGKGDELGYFQFGGSTHCLVFEPGAVDFFAAAVVPQPDRAHVVPVRSALAVARRRTADSAGQAVHMADDDKQTRDDFHHVINMTAAELEQWLDTDESKSVGQKNGGSSESTGHESGREIVDLLRKRVGDLTDDDLAQMKRVHGYVARHLKQRPDKTRDQLEDTPWRYSLMNWGHDPLK